ncbi:hypothetical protein [Micromonospora tulbaghiae]|uniref:hypothetical protein n=1 Tax=Micromonospora tulbaghiae TaxID=479978 RepID=UPI003EBB7434
MDISPRFVRQDPPGRRPRRVRVPGRDDIGVVVDEGKNFGRTPAIYCVGIHFPSTGECVYYDKTRVQEVEDQ